MPRLCRLLAVVAVVAAFAAGPRPALAQTADDLFTDPALHDIHLSLHSADWAKLKAQYLDNTYYPADLEWRGIRVRNVGIRSRGLGTRNGVKPGLRVDMNRYASGQRFLGLRSILLDNAYRDVSGVRDLVSMRLFARMGLPAPRISQARLFVNGEFAGVYAIVEELGEDFVRRVFRLPDSDEPDKGTLYEYKWLDGWNFGYLGGDLDVYKPRFEARTRENDSTAELYQPIEQLVRLVNETSGDRFETEVGALLDLPQLMRYFAIETFLVDYDGLVGYKGMANFYLYRPSHTPRALLIPWDKDQTFFVANRDTGFGIAGNELLRRAIDVPALHAIYLDTLDEAARVAEERAEGASRGWLEEQIARAHDVIAADMIRDPGRWFGVQDFDDEHGRMLEFARTRPAFVRCQTENSRHPESPARTCDAPSRQAPQ